MDNSVKNITTDGSNSNSKTDALPDPNKTGAEFDAKAQKSSSTTTNNSSSSSSSSSNSSSTTSTSSSSSTISENFYTEVVTVPVKTNEVTSTPVSTVTSTESVKKSAGQTIIEYEEPVKTNEQIVDEYIKSLEQSNCDDTAKVYTK